MPFFMKFATPIYHRGLGPSNSSDRQFLAYLCPMRWYRFIQTRAKIFNDHYENLELKSDATSGDIKEAYYRLSKIYHPDVYRGDKNSEKFKSISAAYEVLSDPAKRSQYDTERRFRPHGMTGPGQGMHRYPGNAEYRGGPRRSPTSSQEYDEWVHQNFGDRIYTSTANKKKKKAFKQDPGYQYFWHFFWGTCVTWIALTFFVLFSDKSQFGGGPVHVDVREELKNAQRRDFEYYSTIRKKADDLGSNRKDE